MKTLKFYALASTIALAMVFVSCSEEEADAPFYSGPNSGSNELSSYEEAGLLTLLETQKFHRDVYTWMNTAVENSLFQELALRDGNIMERLSVKVDKYGLENPIIDRTPGEYADSYIQQQYDDFISSNNADLDQFMAYAKQMEASMFSDICECQSILEGNADIGKIYEDMKLECETQLNALYGDTKGLIHIFAIKNEIRDM